MTTVEVDRYPFGTTTFPMCTARLDADGALLVKATYETLDPDYVTRIPPANWYACRVYDARDRVVQQWTNPTPPPEWTPQTDTVHA